MKFVKTASNIQVKMSQQEWETIGKKAGWMDNGIEEQDAQLQEGDVNLYGVTFKIKYKYIPSKDTVRVFEAYTQENLVELLSTAKLLEKLDALATQKYNPQRDDVMEPDTQTAQPTGAPPVQQPHWSDPAADRPLV
jgi:hypothetical protein